MAITMLEGYDADAMMLTLGGLVEGPDRIPSGLLKSVTFDQGSEWAEWETLAATLTTTSGSATRTRRGNAVRSRTRTGPGAGGSPVAPDSTTSTEPTSTEPPTSSTANADATSTTSHPRASTLQPPCTDHWNWPRPPWPQPRDQSRGISTHVEAGALFPDKLDPP